MDVSGPVDFLALTFPTHQVGPAVVESVAEVVVHRDARILDLLLIIREDDGAIRVLDVEDHLDRHGLAPLLPEGGALMSDDDVETVASSLEPGQAAVLLVYENVWAVRVAKAVRAAGGAVALHVHVPVDAVNAAVEADNLARMS
jgi:hypothetical protein